ncbi:hypothetical protein [Calothrix sp. CCY 0018]|uniref:hypothetical protein n=1 Tax=Calothrix sp. CCY 0018 TaxID=3103864 RepID=UPI0039C63E3B
MIPISQLHYFLHYRKFFLIVALAVTAVAQITPAQATEFKENTNTLETLKLDNVNSKSIAADDLLQNRKSLKKELSDNLQQATLINRLKASKLNSTIPVSQNISEPEFLTSDKLTDVNRVNTEINPTDNNLLQAQNTSEQDVEKIINQLDAVKDIEIPSFFYSPGFSIYVPTGFGGDRNTGFVSASYQERGRFSDDDDVGLGFGVGLGDSRKSVGVELSYTLASFGRNRDFGSGGFNVKVHRQLPNDWGVAVGWNGFLNIGDENNFEQSLYGVATKIIRTQEKLEKPFSRVAVTLGVGGGQFRTEEAVFDGDDEISVFGSVAVRAVKSASIIAEWTGQDLGVGVSVAPFPNIPLVITPALRDITGAGDGTRFVVGTGFSFKF